MSAKDSCIDENFFDELRKKHQKYKDERTEIIKRSNEILSSSKSIIFALHRNEIKTTQSEIIKIVNELTALKERFGLFRLSQEGSYKAGVEEYLEAKMFFLFLSGEKISESEIIKLDFLTFDSYLAAISDLTGELARHATNLAADGQISEIKKIKLAIEEIMLRLAKFNMTGNYLRSKYDQANRNLTKIDQINYEINLKYN